MQLYPAIDIKNGQCVRLRQGRFEEVQIYSNHPLEIAKQFEKNGASYIHIVDLDGALEGRGINQEVIEEIAKGVSIPVQTGGGIRTLKDIESKLSGGIRRVIIGTKALKDASFVKEAIGLFGAEQIVVGIDAKDGFVAIEGWEFVSATESVAFCLQMKALGVTNIVYTDISKDGMLQGPNIHYTKKLIDETGLNIIASGGVSSLGDLEKLNDIKASGAIIGKAIYENKIDLKMALSLYEGR